LNQLGYGKAGSGLILNLVYNPGGAFLPGDQEELEADYKRILLSEHGITFNQLLTITNMPINRYAKVLKKEGQYEEYCFCWRLALILTLWKRSCVSRKFQWAGMGYCMIVTLIRRLEFRFYLIGIQSWSWRAFQM
jgi:hypothetical protein